MGNVEGLFHPFPVENIPFQRNKIFPWINLIASVGTELNKH